jgi:hypothetical protein
LIWTRVPMHGLLNICLMLHRRTEEYFSLDDNFVE